MTSAGRVTYGVGAAELALDVAHLADVVGVGVGSERTLLHAVVAQLHVATRHAVLTRLKVQVRL